MVDRLNGVTADATTPPPASPEDLSTTAGKLADLKVRYHEAVTASGEAAIEKQHAKGKKTARERIELLLDQGSFVELDEFVRHRTHAFGMENNRPYGDSVVTGTGTIHGRQVAVYCAGLHRSSAARSARSPARRSSRSCSSPSRPACRSSACSTRAARGSRRAWSPSASTARSSG